jgi:hypothetical protein
MAAKEPLHFGASIVFSRDQEAEDEFMRTHLGVEKSMGDAEGQSFRSPDPANVENLPHARCAQLHAADLVDDPAATDGMFSAAGGTALAAQMTEWLDTHPEVFKALQEPGMLELLGRYSDRLEPFAKVYLANRPAGSAEIAPVKPEPDHAAEFAAVKAKAEAEIQTLTARVSALESDTARLTGELSGATTRAETAEAALAVTTTTRDEIAGRLSTMEAESEKLKADLTEANRKVAAYESGQPPVSSASASESEKNAGTLMERARASRK